jgi:peptidoglycan hydrolase-like protein with peptidoglycan-binding domain
MTRIVLNATSSLLSPSRRARRPAALATLAKAPVRALGDPAAGPAPALAPAPAPRGRYLPSRAPSPEQPASTLPRANVLPVLYCPAPSLGELRSGRFLALGHEGQAVERLQDLLNRNGAQPPLELDGKFGPKTLAALKAVAGTRSAGQEVLDRLSASAGPEPAVPRSAGFTASRVLDDAALLDKDAMSALQIQAFLDAHHSVLATYHGADGRSAAEMIDQAAKKNGINPEFLLATLQKEQGLISKSSATAGQLDWALGYGATDHGRLQQFSGFGTQVDDAAARVRALYEEGQKQVPTSMMIDGQRQPIDNAATYMLYQYTPHADGVRLFHDVWTGYFGG